MWDDGLNGRFCAECFDHVVDAEELLVNQGLRPRRPEDQESIADRTLERKCPKALPMECSQRGEKFLWSRRQDSR